MRHVAFTLTPLIVAGAAALVSTSSHAAVISLNITNGATGNTLSSTDVVGVVPAANWNNTNAPDANSVRSFSNLTDNTGAITTTDVTLGGVPYTYNNNTPAMSPPMDDDAIMMRTALGSSGNGNDRTATFTSVLYQQYDVYVYFGGATTEASVPYIMNVSFQAWDGSTYTNVGDTKYMRDGNRVWDGTYDESTATTSAAAVDGNDYVVFHNMSGSQFRILADNVNRRAGLAGIQIVEVAPEPATLVLTGLGGLLMLFQGRRRAV